MNRFVLYLTSTSGYFTIEPKSIMKQPLRLVQYQAIFNPTEDPARTAAANSKAARSLVLNIDTIFSGYQSSIGYVSESQRDSTSMILPLDNNDITLRDCDITILLNDDLNKTNPFNITSISGTLNDFVSLTLIFEYEYSKM